ncbi:MAG TPA: hypothetical protein VFG10_14265 [Saprospiraceae bacterium]|nr:hypothetical protein [Saprospiraceae bacterium]
MNTGIYAIRNLIICIIGFLLIACFTHEANGQVTVAGSGGAANGTFATLKLAFNALNAVSTQAGNTITVSITANITDNNVAVLNQPSVSSWTSLTISPAGGSWTLNGFILGPVIDLNGADNVTINGLNSGGNALTLSNAIQVDIQGNSTIRLINDATNNTITNCTILGSTLSSAMQVGTGTIPTAATILISTSNGSTGNDNNTISNNKLAEAGVIPPAVVICSAGQSTSISNDNCIITGNNISNFYDAHGANGIAIASNSSSFTITSNKFYQTVPTMGMLSDRYLDHIVINTPSGGGYIINNNIIGFADANGNGMLTNNGGRFSGIDLMSVAASPISEIQGNTINGINWTSAFNSANNAPFNAFNAYAVRAGGVNFGTTTGNILGATSGTGSATSNIYISNSGNPISICMLYLSSSTSCTISNNLMGAITTGPLTNYLFGIVAEGSGSHTIQSNLIGNDTPGNIKVGNNDSNAGYFRGITCSATGNEIIGSAGQGNKIQHISFTSSNYNDFIGISVFNNPLSMNINYNTIHDIVYSNTFGSPTSFVGITNTGGIGNALNINNNQLGSATYGLVTFLTTQTLSGTLTGINSANISPSCSMSISNNDFRGITQASGSSNEPHKYITWNHANAVTDNINNNTFTNLNVKSSTLAFLTRAGNMTATGIENVNGNSIVTGFTKSAGHGNIYFFDGGGNSSTSATMNNQNNNFSNVTISDFSIVNGWENRDGTFGVGGPKKIITGNTFQNITAPSNAGPINGIYMQYYGQGSSLSNNTIRNFSTGSFITGLYVFTLTTTTGSLQVSDNVIGDFTSGQNYIYGIQLRSYNCTVTKNKLFNFTANSTSSSVRGIFADLSNSSGFVLDINNNLIGNLNTPVATGSNAVVGLYVAPFTTSTINADYNTIYLASTGGNGFGSSGIYHEANTTSATGLLTLRNNILLNLSTPGAGGLSVAFRRSSGSASMLNNYASASNNNLFYAGIPSANRLIYYDGVSSAMTLNAYKGAAFTAGVVAPRDAFSVSEPITAATFFVSTTGTDPGFLHINPSNPTQVENGGMVLGTITDYDGENRGGATPDIGADEGAFTFNDLLGPTITHAPIVKGNVSNTQSFTNVIITDVSNVEGSTGIRPRVYYKRSTDANVFNDNTNATTGWKYAEANTSVSPFDFTIDYTLLSGGAGVAVGNTVQYFVVAQDQHAPVNLGLQSGVFNVEPSTVVLPNTAFPITGNIKSFPIVNSLSGTFLVPGNFPTLTGAGGAFEAINANVVTGNINIELTANNGAEHGLNSLNEFAAPFTIKIYPTGAPRFLAGAANSVGIIKLNGADRVTIDGSVGGTGTDRSLTLTNFSTSFPSIIVVNSLGTGAGANQNTIKNCNISIGNFNHSSYGISIGGITPGSSGADNDDITLQNNNITNVSTGIYANGTSATSTGGNDNLQILNNTFTTNTSAPECNGIRVGNALNCVVKGNMFDITGTNSVYPVAISFETGCSSSQITSNLISYVRASSNGYGSRGIVIGTGSMNSDIIIANNVLYSIHGWDNADITKSSMGICIGLLGNTLTTTATGGIKLFYNSINMFNSFGIANTINAALYIGSTAGNLDIRNNIFSNQNSFTNSQIKYYAIYSAAPNTAFSSINYNDYYAVNTNNPALSIPGFITTDRLDLAAIQAGFGQNVNSIISNPSFVGFSDLRPTTGSVLGVANNAGTGITVDYLSAARNTGAPPNGSTMGAYENGFDNSAPVIQYTSLPSTCSTDDRTLTATITDINGVPVTGTFMPRIYFKKNSGSYFSSPGVLATGTGMNGTWIFTISATTLGGIIASDVISYFVIAQDNSVPIKISSNPSTGLVATNVNTVTNPPTTPNTYSVLYTLGSGTYSVGTLNVGGEIGHFPTITSAIQAYNAACLTGAPVFVLTDNTYSGSETFPITISQNNLASNVNVLTIKPASGMTPVISGSAATSLIDIVGGDYVVIDGSNNGTSTKNLTLSNTNTSGSVMRFSNDATHNSVNNCILKGVSTSTSTGVVYFASTTFAGGNDFNVIQNNDITAGISTNANGVYNSGNTSTSTSKNSGLQIIGNNIYNFSNAGILDNGGSIGTLYQNNQIYEVINQPSSQISGYTCASNTIEGFIFRGNRIYDLKASIYTTVNGIYILGIAPGPVGEITNNMVALNTVNVINSYAIADYTATGTVLKIDFNSFSISGSGFGFSAVYYRVANSSVELKNNIISNTKVNGSPNYTMYIQGSTNNITSDYNNLYSLPSGNLGLFGNTSLYNFASWKSFTNQDQHSLNVQNAFQSPTDLHLVLNGNCNFENAGIAIPGLNTDFDNENRNSNPDIGADEFTGVPLSTYPAGPDQIICSPSTLMAATTGPNGSTGTWSIVTGYGFFSNINSPTSTVSNLGPGLNTFKWTVTYGTCSVNSNVNITNNAVGITYCSTNLYGFAQEGTCTAVLDYEVYSIGSPAPTFTYAFSGATTSSGTGTGSGKIFNVGITNVTVTATNGCGADAICGFQIDVFTPEIVVTGNNTNIADGQLVALLSNHTNFDTIIKNTPLTRTFTISNSADVFMTLGNVSVIGPDSSMFTVTQPLETTLYSGNSTTFTVTCVPEGLGWKTATIHIANSDCNETDFDFVVKGYGHNRYRFIGSGDWTETNKWYPSYPGLTLHAGLEAYADNDGSINIPSNIKVNINGDLYVPYLFSALGDITIGSQGSFSVGFMELSDTLLIQTGGQFNVDDGGLFINNYPVGALLNHGIATINNSELTNESFVYNFPGATFISKYLIRNYVLFENHGLFIANGTMEGSIQNMPDGTMQIAEPNQCLYNWDQLTTQGTLELDIDGTNNDCAHFDKVYGFGWLELAGTLKLNINYSPSNGDAITILEGGGLLNQFAVFDAPPGWTIHYNDPSPNKVTVKFNCTTTVITSQPLYTQKVCQDAIPSTIAVSASGSGLQYQWYQDTWYEGYNGTMIIGANSPTYVPPTPVPGTYFFYAKVTGQCGEVYSDYSEMNVDARGTWVGATSSNWHTTSNWCGGVPDVTTDVFISVKPFNPIVSTANAICRSIYIFPDATLGVNAPRELRVMGQ